ncbi:MAG: hypothetical protein IT337_10150 [Thermomicrobiales bacterium]|nr:hypothetical protein [Thermomicrobiales bacterium]
MRIVCLNLDIEDATLLRRALIGAMDGTSAGSVRKTDADARALGAMIGELDRLLATDAPRRDFRLPAVLAAGDSIVEPPRTPHLQLVRGGLLAD